MILGIGIGFFYGSLFSDPQISLVGTLISIIPGLLFMGFLRNTNDIPVSFRWIQWL